MECIRARQLIESAQSLFKPKHPDSVIVLVDQETYEFCRHPDGSLAMFSSVGKADRFHTLKDYAHGDVCLVSWENLVNDSRLSGHSLDGVLDRTGDMEDKAKSFKLK